MEKKMTFKDETEFEKAFVKELEHNGWRDGTLLYPDEKDLLKNWKNILEKNNQDRLSNLPLVDEEINQIMEKLREAKTPFAVNKLITGQEISIRRSNEDDKRNYGKEVYLTIFKRDNVAGGNSVYQIARQPRFTSSDVMYPKRRGDVMLLINGMPVIHCELKNDNISIKNATNQIKTYSEEGAFRGIFSLVQVFFALNPEECVYFANPGEDGVFNPLFYFHWADHNNEIIKSWVDITKTILRIPLAHELIGYYTVADDKDGKLKVMRYYQIYACEEMICKIIDKDRGELKDNKGGFVWHTTGSGKTLTSFKLAQLLSSTHKRKEGESEKEWQKRCKKMHKVVLLLDRVELYDQTYREYMCFKSDDEDVQKTNDTNDLISKLKSPDYKDSLIVTSIQKMKNIKDISLKKNITEDIKKIQKNNLVFVIDECHRDTFGDMLLTIKNTFPDALFFGFTGTPIFKENKKNESTTSTIFGPELTCRYSIADGMRDKTVLGFSKVGISTYQDSTLREAVALSECNVQKFEEIQDPKLLEKYYKIYNLPMVGHKEDGGRYIEGIEDKVPSSQYDNKEHRKEVVNEVFKHFNHLTVNRKYHAIFTTTSINEAIEYYKLFKEENKERENPLRFTCQFDLSDPCDENAFEREEEIKNILIDYNAMFSTSFTLSQYNSFKKDISTRLAHKKPYTNLAPDKTLDILIVVEQMLTGYDSNYVNTLFVDKVLSNEHLIQAFSRTNRVFEKDKPFGNIYFFRKIHTMERNIKEAFELYSGNKDFSPFVPDMTEGIKIINDEFHKIEEIFALENILNFSSLPKSKGNQKKFKSSFSKLEKYYRVILLQGFSWENEEDSKRLDLTKEEYFVLYKLYLEIKEPDGGDGDDESGKAPFNISTAVTENEMEIINSEYMNKSFHKFIRDLNTVGISKEELDVEINNLLENFSMLTDENERMLARVFIMEIQHNPKKFVFDEEHTFMYYLNKFIDGEYKDDEIERLSFSLGVDKDKLLDLCAIPKENRKEYGKLNELMSSIDEKKAILYFFDKEKIKYSVFEARIKAENELLRFLDNF